MEKFLELAKITDFNWEEDSISFCKIKKLLINIKQLKNSIILMSLSNQSMLESSIIYFWDNQENYMVLGTINMVK
jgi:hypothetical protein